LVYLSHDHKKRQNHGFLFQLNYIYYEGPIVSPLSLIQNPKWCDLGQKTNAYRTCYGIVEYPTNLQFCLLSLTYIIINY
jgi:hypothetical protein